MLIYKVNKSFKGETEIKYFVSELEALRYAYGHIPDGTYSIVEEIEVIDD